MNLKRARQLVAFGMLELPEGMHPARWAAIIKHIQREYPALG